MSHGFAPHRRRASVPDDPRHSATRWASLAVALLGMSALAGASSCTETFQGVACHQDSDCPTGQGCDEEASVCRPSCLTSDECPTHAYRCDRGLCVEVENPECTAAADCTTPGACESLTSVSCVEGACAYSEVVCDQPPASECVNNDSQIRSYVDIGTCSVQTGQCEYAYTDSGCADCAVNCLGSNACDGVTCPDDNGGCKVQGVCVPTTPYTCAYQDAPTNTPCDRPGSATGALDGFCNQGACGDAVPVACADNAACAPDTCIGGYCNPAAGLGETCDSGDDADCATGLACEGGVCLRTDGQTCSDNGECLHTCIAATCAGASVAGGPCDSASGGDDDDCQAGLHCNSGVCETSLACTTNSGCSGGDTCIGGYCRAPAATGGACDPGDDADCQAGNACTNGVCLLANGQACSSNAQCVEICAASTCAAPSGTHGPCDVSDGAADCQPGHLCPAGECLLETGQSGCTSDGDCVETCIGGQCAGMASTGDPCDSPGDCLTGHQCSGGHCLLENGQSCSDNADCLNVCVAGACAAPSPTGGDCDTADGAADCQSGATCVSGACRLLDGQTCSADSQCEHTCIGGTCGPLSGSGGACDDENDCQPSLVCVSTTCQVNGVAQIRIQGSYVGGGGDLYAWHRVDVNGADLATVSANFPNSNTGLYSTIDWTADLTEVVGAGSYLAVAGSSGSAGLTRTFTFYDGLGAVIDVLVVDSANGSSWIERDLGSGVDWFVRFYYDGTHVTFKQRYPYIDSILVEGTTTLNGGGSPLSGYYEVDASGGNLGQLSPGASGPLYSTGSWEVSLTRPIYGDMRFVLVGSEGSVNITRTFTFKNASGGTVDTVVVSDLDSGHIVRTNTWPSSDTFTMFTYQNGVVTGVQTTQ